uniref:hypothetical protein n=1 Tax=Lactococcus sp. TaxID=44273 RepID=UPI0034DD0AA0
MNNLILEQIKKLENLLIQEREKAKQVQIKINRSVLQNNSENYKEEKTDTAINSKRRFS